MLPYDSRLTKRKDFEKIYRRGKFFYFGIVGIKILKNDLKNARIGMAIGQKYSKKAVERNKIKRQIREILRKNLTKVRGGFDVVVIIKKKKAISFGELEKMLLEALSLAGLIK